jgi:hypothetical protein
MYIKCLQRKEKQNLLAVLNDIKFQSVKVLRTGPFKASMDKVRADEERIVLRISDCKHPHLRHNHPRSLIRPDNE